MKRQQYGERLIVCRSVERQRGLDNDLAPRDCSCNLFGVLCSTLRQAIIERAVQTTSEKNNQSRVATKQVIQRAETSGASSKPDAAKSLLCRGILAVSSWHWHIAALT